MRWRRLGSVLALGLLGAAGCTVFLPERFTVHGPFMNGFLGWGIPTPDETEVSSRLHVPEGFSVRLYAGDLPQARFLRFTTAGDLLVSQPRQGVVTLLVRDAAGHVVERRQLLTGLNLPHGIDWYDGWLYVAETDALGRIRFDPAQRTVSGPFERLVTGIPASHHWTRTVRIGPDRKLYLSIGSSCNVCEETDRRRAAIVRYDLDGTHEEIFATGLRNSVGFDWRPATGELFATDNGRDLLGDDFPPCELNRIVQGGFYGFPVANGNRTPDPDYGAGQDARIAATIPPVHEFRAHNAPLGITFLRGDRVPPAYRGAALVALHGSWNRSTMDGYKVVSLHWQPDGTIERRDFLTGFVANETAIGRPVDVTEGPDGAFYVSDDYGGAIYRVAYGTQSADPAPAPHATTPTGRTLAALEPAERAAREARGARRFEQLACNECHGPNAPTPRPLLHLSARHTLDSLVAFLAAPTPPMPRFPLTDDERLDLAVFLLASRP